MTKQRACPQCGRNLKVVGIDDDAPAAADYVCVWCEAWFTFDDVRRHELKMQPSPEGN